MAPTRKACLALAAVVVVVEPLQLGGDPRLERRRPPTDHVGGVMGRRTAAFFVANVVAGPLLLPRATSAAETTTPPLLSELPSVASAPSWTLLVPLVEFEAVLRSWTAELRSASSEAGASADAVRTIGARLDALDAGFPLSPKFFYLGVGTKYAQSIKYDDLDGALVARDRDARLRAMVDANVALDRARKRAATAVKAASRAPDAGAASSEVAASLGDAVVAVRGFLDRCPRSDVDAAAGALRTFREADADFDGVVTEAEFYASDLTEEQRLAAVWGVWGTTFLDNTRPPYDGIVRFDPLKLSVAPPVPPTMRAAIAMGEF